MKRVIDYGERLAMALLAIPFLIAFVRVLPTHPTFILTAVSELLMVVFILIRRRGDMAATPYAFFIGFTGTCLPMLARPTNHALAPTVLTTTIMLAGMVLSIAAKLWLNRSFGLVAAHRGLKLGGPYRLVRHPMYAGYVVTHAGFLLASFSVRNLVVYLLTWTFLLLRIVEEERLLRADGAYRDYAARVRYRLAPGLF